MRTTTMLNKPKLSKSHRLYAKCRDRGMTPDRAAVVARRVTGLSQFHGKPPEKYCYACKRYDCSHVAPAAAPPAVAKYAAKHEITPELIESFKVQIAALDDATDPMGVVAGLEVWKVDGDAVKIEHSMDFVEAGNGYRWQFIPKAEIWVDEDLEEHDWRFNVLHESVEVHLMQGGMEYDKAHVIANRHEKTWRIETAMNALADSMPCSECGEVGCDHAAEHVAHYCVEKYAMKVNVDRAKAKQKAGPIKTNPVHEDEEGKHWITIGGHPGPDGKHVGGVHVEVHGGTIVKGPEKMIGKTPDDPMGEKNDGEPLAMAPYTDEDEQRDKKAAREYRRQKRTRSSENEPRLSPEQEKKLGQHFAQQRAAASDTSLDVPDRDGVHARYLFRCGSSIQSFETAAQAFGKQQYIGNGRVYADFDGQREELQPPVEEPHAPQSTPEGQPTAAPQGEAAPAEEPFALAPATDTKKDKWIPAAGGKETQKTMLSTGGLPGQGDLFSTEGSEPERDPNAPSPERTAAQAASLAKNGPVPPSMRDMKIQAAKELEESYNASKAARLGKAPKSDKAAAKEFNELAAEGKFEGQMPTAATKGPTPEDIEKAKADKKAAAQAKRAGTIEAKKAAVAEKEQEARDAADSLGVDVEFLKDTAESLLGDSSESSDYNKQLASLMKDAHLSEKEQSAIENADNDADLVNHINDKLIGDWATQYPLLGLREDSTQQDVLDVIQRGEMDAPSWLDKIRDAASIIENLSAQSDPWDESSGFDDAEQLLSEAEQPEQLPEFEGALTQEEEAAQKDAATAAKHAPEPPASAPEQPAAAPHKTLSEEMAERQKQLTESGKREQLAPHEVKELKPTRTGSETQRLITKVAKPGMTQDELNAAMDKAEEEERQAAAAAPQKKGRIKTQTPEELQAIKEAGKKRTNEAYAERRKMDVATDAEKKTNAAKLIQAREKAKQETLNISAETKARTKAFLIQARDRLKKSGTNRELEQAIAGWLSSLTDAASPFWDMRNVSAGMRRYGTKTSKPGTRKAWSNR